MSHHFGTSSPFLPQKPSPPSKPFHTLPHPSLSRSKADAGELTEPVFMEELQRRMERVVLGLQVRG